MPSLDQQEPENIAPRGQTTLRPARAPRRLSTASMIGPPRRTVITGNVSNANGPVLQHKPNYRHVSGGILYKSVQEGMEAGETVGELREETDNGAIGRKGVHKRAGSAFTLQQPVTTLNTTPSHNRPNMSVHDYRNMTFGKNMPMSRNRAKSPVPGSNGSVLHAPAEPTLKQKEVYPGDKVFTPVVTCRYPETDWKDADPFPAFLPMSESEIEYAKAIKAKISVEKRLLKSLQMQLREEKTLGRRARQTQLRREIVDSEEKLSLLEDQMKPWRGLFVEVEDAWIPRSIGLVSAVPYHFLLRDWLLAVVVACSGGVEHPGMSLASLRLESYVKNIIHEVSLPPFGKLEVGITINNRVLYASRPALNSVPIVKNFSLYPLFRCLSAEDIVTIIEVILSEGKVVFVSSYLGMLTLASESILYLLFPFYWQGVYIPILPSSLMTCLQAPVPYIIGIERKSQDPDFPPEDACVVDLDKGVIDVQLAPTQLPPRQRRKLIQSLEQYAPTSAIRRSSTIDNPAHGPPDYVKEAFPYSRLTLFCGVSRAPRWGKRIESSRPHSTVPNGTPSGRASVDQNGSIMGDNRYSGSLRELDSLSSLSSSATKSSLTLDNSQLGMNGQRAQYASENKGGMARSTYDGVHDRDAEWDTKDMKQKRDALSRSNSAQEAGLYSHHNTMDLSKPGPRKGVSSTKTRSAIFETTKRLEGANHYINGNMMPVHPGIRRQNSTHSTHSTHMGSAASGYEGPGLTHRASFTSIDSASSSVFSKSPISAMTSNTMFSINGPSTSTITGVPTCTDDDGLVRDTGETSAMGPITIEGHVLSPVSTPIPLPLLNCRCGICARSLSLHNEVYRCEGCVLYVHAGCVDELLYPCVPRGIDESGVCWSVLQMWAGLMKGYRSGIMPMQQQSQQSMSQQQYQQHMFVHQNGSPRSHGHAKQHSNAGSEGEREGRDRLSWANFQRWTGRSGSISGSNSNLRGSITFSPSSRASTNVEQVHQQQQRSQVSSQPRTRGRSGTQGSAQSDIMSFHRDVFMKGVDKEARPFLSAFTESQAFGQFIQDRVDRSPGDPEIMFFDEVIKAKINRSRFRLGREETKFLDDPSYGVQGTLKAVPPSGDIQAYDNDARRFPTSLDPAYL
ncbi:hypothetical protein BG011_003144 [Mortierella polycephala]|uniref:DENN-domain-containing protein n=1 Tax=Mortierella polycephala TaxID=41804 RepID=A0A9P6Q2Z7_9FUNG|nr:hypothetical protein BG011_003144 [Mortierella polycephala]